MSANARWPRVAAAAAAGLVLGSTALAGGALLLYSGDGVLVSTGFLMALTVFSVAAGLWVGAPDAPVPGHRRMLGRWTLAVLVLVLASFIATWWLDSPWLQQSRFGPPLALVILLAEPAYALGALLGALEARRRGWLGERWFALQARPRAFGGRGSGPTRPAGRAAGVAVPALVGVAVGVLLATGFLIPMLPPGPVYLVGALILTTAGTLEMSVAGDPKEDSMRDRVVLVTGVGGRGQVGYAVAEAFVVRGAQVVVTGRSDSVTEAAAELGTDVVGVAADLTIEADAGRVVEELRERWGRLDVLVNVAGGLRVVKPLAETTPAEWQREIAANAGTAFTMTRAALPLLRERQGVVINFASPAGERAVKGMGAYSAAKAGVVALTRALALEEKAAGVRVNAVAPGMVDTAQNRAEVADPEAVDWVTREELVQVVLFLASDAASGVTGEVIQVPGRGLA